MAVFLGRARPPNVEVQTGVGGLCEINIFAPELLHHFRPSQVLASSQPYMQSIFLSCHGYLHTNHAHVLPGKSQLIDGRLAARKCETEPVLLGRSQCAVISDMAISPARLRRAEANLRWPEYRAVRRPRSCPTLQHSSQWPPYLQTSLLMGTAINILPAMGIPLGGLTSKFALLLMRRVSMGYTSFPPQSRSH